MALRTCHYTSGCFTYIFDVLFPKTETARMNYERVSTEDAKFKSARVISDEGSIHKG
jgi:hypothetical protein